MTTTISDLSRVTEQRDLAVAALRETRKHAEYMSANANWIVIDALARIAALDPKPAQARQITPETRPPSQVPTYPKFPAYDGPDRRRGERRSKPSAHPTEEWELTDGRRKTDRRNPQPDADGWIEWRGEIIGYREADKVEVRCDGAGRIIAYRIVGEGK
jgi:hypothetical protein